MGHSAVSQQRFSGVFQPGGRESLPGRIPCLSTQGYSFLQSLTWQVLPRNHDVGGQFGRGCSVKVVPLFSLQVGLGIRAVDFSILEHQSDFSSLPNLVSCEQFDSRKVCPNAFTGCVGAFGFPHSCRSQILKAPQDLEPSYHIHPSLASPIWQFNSSPTHPIQLLPSWVPSKPSVTIPVRQAPSDRSLAWRHREADAPRVAERATCRWVGLSEESKKEKKERTLKILRFFLPLSGSQTGSHGTRSFGTSGAFFRVNSVGDRTVH